MVWSLLWPGTLLKFSSIISLDRLQPLTTLSRIKQGIVNRCEIHETQEFWTTNLIICTICIICTHSKLNWLSEGSKVEWSEKWLGTLTHRPAPKCISTQTVSKISHRQIFMCQSTQSLVEWSWSWWNVVDSLVTKSGWQQFPLGVVEVKFSYGKMLFCIRCDVNVGLQ